jgi:hypothetical protein
MEDFSQPRRRLLDGAADGKKSEDNGNKRLFFKQFPDRIALRTRLAVSLLNSPCLNNRYTLSAGPRFAE